MLHPILILGIFINPAPGVQDLNFAIPISIKKKMLDTPLGKNMENDR